MILAWRAGSVLRRRSILAASATMPTMSFGRLNALILFVFIAHLPVGERNAYHSGPTACPAQST